MSTALPLVFGSGFLVGLASSLHCAGMCGSIGSALVLAVDPNGVTAAGSRMLLLTQAGRVLAYSVAGLAVGLLGTGVVHLFDQATAFVVLKSAGAAALVWIGLSTAGLLPSPAAFDRWAAPAASLVISATRMVPGGSPGASVATGIAWGFMPCAMVYAALFVAMLQGTATGGAVFMLGFGLATLPAVIGASLGVASLRRAARGHLRAPLGLAIAGAGLLSVSLSPLIGFLCRPT